MKLRLILALLIIRSGLAAEADWRPKPDEAAVVGDPRFEAISVYQDADAAMRVYAYIHTRQKSPGDEEDHLLTDFQESFGAAHILKPLDFLVAYPDSDLVSRLLRFQTERTSGIWPPWKYLAIRIFRDHPKEFSAYYSSLNSDKKEKIAADVRMGFDLATAPFSPMSYRIPARDQPLVAQRIKELSK